MPNWVTNIITITGSDEELLKVFESGFDFQKILPCPYINGERSTDEKWYNWCVSHWGTKWPADDINLDKDFREDGNALRIRCYTAWSPPTGLLGYLSKIYPSLTISNKFSDEMADFYGFIVCQKGSVEYKKLDPHNYKPKTILGLQDKYTWFSPEDYVLFMKDMGCDVEKLDNDPAYSEGPVKLIEHTFTYDEFVEEMSKESKDE